MYYHHWLNISAELGNGIFDGHTVLGIPKGYYNVCELDKEAFRPLGAEFSLHAPTGRLQIFSKKMPGAESRAGRPPRVLSRDV